MKSCFVFIIYCIYYLEEEDYKKCLRELDNLSCLLKDYLNTKEKLEQQVQEAILSQDKEVYSNLLENLDKKLPQVKVMELGVRLIEASIQIKIYQKIQSSR